MFLEKLEHYLRLFFFFTLVLTQSMIFVASRAADDSSLLEVVFLEPVSGHTIKVGDQLNLQAKLSTPKNTDLSVAYFSVIDVNSGLNENFEAYKGKDDIWRSSGAWDTSVLKSGQYLLSATAYVYKDGQPEHIYYSIPEIFNLASDKVEAAVSSGPVFTSPTANQVVSTSTMDITVSSTAVLSNIVFNIKAWDIATNAATGSTLKTFSGNNLGNNLWGLRQADISALANGYYIIYMTADKDDGLPDSGDDILQGAAISQVSIQALFSVNRSSAVDTEQPSEEILTGTVVSPQAEQTVSGSFLVKLQLNRALGSDEELLGKIYNNSLSLIKQFDLGKSSNPLVYQTTIDSAALGSNASPIYPDGRYRLEVVLDKASYDSQLNLINFSVDNIDDEIADKEIDIKNPLAGSVISDDKLLVEVETNFEAESLIVTLLNKNDSAIATSDISIPKLDGYNWSGVINLDNTFIDGSYNLQFTAKSTAQETIDKVVSLALNRQGDNSVAAPQDIKAIIINKRTNLSGVDFLVLASNISSSDFYCTLTNSLDASQTKDVAATNISWNQLTGLGIKQSDYPDANYAYLVSFDTSALSNGNYKTVVKNKKYPNLPTPTVYISIFNQSSVGDNNQSSSSDGFLEKSLVIADNYDVVGDGQQANFYLEANFLTQANNLFVFQSDTSNLIKEDSFKKETAVGSNGSYRYTYTFSAEQLPDGKYYLYAVEYDPATKIVLAESNILNFSIEQGRFVDLPPDNTSDDNSGSADYKIHNNFRGLGVGLYASCLEAYLDSDNYCQIFSAWQSSINDDCVAHGILDQMACEDYLNRTQVDAICQAQGIIDKEACKDYLIEKYGQSIICRLSDQNECTQAIRNNFVNILAIKNQISQSLYQLDSELPSDKHLDFKELAAKLAARGLNQNILPFADSTEARVMVAPALAETVLIDRETLDITGPILLMVDTDSDGLPDDLEKYYGSDPNKIDSDGDSYSDFTELVNGYNPIGSGKLEQLRTNFDQALLGSVRWEQPKVKSDKIDANLNVIRVKNNNGLLELTGKAEANALLTLYFYSQVPLMTVVKTDANGDWVYDLPWALSDGYHRVYVAQNNSDGTLIVQSEPTAFVIKDGQPIKISEYFTATVEPIAKSKPWLFYVLGAAGLLVFFALILIILRRIKKTSATPM